MKEGPPGDVRDADNVVLTVKNGRRFTLKDLLREAGEARPTRETKCNRG